MKKTLVMGLSRIFPLQTYFNTNTKTLPCIRMRASITVEAALAVPVFVLFVVLFLGLFRVEQVELQMNQALSHTVSEIAMKSEYLFTDLMKAKPMLVKQLKSQECAEEYIRNGWQGIAVTSTESDDDYVRLSATYEICLPVSLFGWQYLEVTQSAVARRWTGDAGLSEEDDAWVYITPYGAAYHQVSSCRYLDLSVWAAPKVQVAALRNENGEKYDACTICAQDSYKSVDATVYVTGYGTLYHHTLDCRNLKRTVYRVRKESIEGRSPCQKCCKGNES